MAAYTEEALDKLSKKNIIDLVLVLQNKLETGNTEVLDEIRKLNANFAKLESELIVTKKVNSELQKHVIDLERQCWANAQYSRRECLELAGIPSTVGHDELEGKVVDILNKVGSNIDNDKIEACHRISGNNDRVIIKFSRRKDCQHVLSVKRDLKKLNMDEVGLPENCKVFINQSLCSYYKLLWSKSKKLHSMGKIHNFFISNGTVKVIINEGSSPLSITHNTDFEKYFPGIDLSPSQ